MEITIIGWYGTETIGDRAILAGIIRVLSCVFPSFEINIGSLYPFFSERILQEDVSFFEELSSKKLQSVSLFDSRNPVQLKHNIRKTDLLLVGGGPLMDLTEMNMLEYAFLYAHNKKVKTMLFGCGWGPLKNKTIIDKAIHLVELANCTVFRDSLSEKQCLAHCHSFSGKIHSSVDPAVFACDYFIKNIKEERTKDHISINFRDAALEGDHYIKNTIPEEFLCRIVDSIASQTDLQINLVPMHSFFIGGDDRVILTKIEKKLNSPRIKTIQKPLNLYDTMSEYYHSCYCIGMRFHSVVLQTILNGKNYVVDYTDPSNGKIIGFLKQLNIFDHFKERYLSLHSGDDAFCFDLHNLVRYKYDPEQTAHHFKQYVDCLKSI